MSDPEIVDGGDRFCSDHSRGIRHEPHPWIRYLGENKSRRVRHHCSGSTLGQYASREEWREATRAAAEVATPKPKGRIKQ